MKIYQNKTVYEAALDRLRLIFDEFDTVCVGTSGGKDSTVMVELALIVAREKDRLPLKVLFIDQEAEWTETINTIRIQFAREEIDPLWLQIPFRIFNATSFEKDWLECWEPGAEWLRDKEPDSIHENTYGTDRFAELFAAISQQLSPDSTFAYVSGVRAEEAPKRYVSLTQHVTYKWITWGRKHPGNPKHFTFYPLYDWSYTDIWKAIHDNDWHYNKIYDAQYQYGVKTPDMRVSNLNHETAVRNLFYMQEVDPDLHNRLTKRLEGVDAATKMQEDFFSRDLPFMFSGWTEYREYLMEHLVAKENQKAFRTIFNRHERQPGFHGEREIKCLQGHVQAILTNDWNGAKLASLALRLFLREKDDPGRAVRKKIWKEKAIEI